MATWFRIATRPHDLEAATSIITSPRPRKPPPLAVKAGCNLCCGGDYNALVRAVQQNLLGEKDIDQALYYTLWTRFRLGLFDPPEKVPYSKITISQNDTPEHRQVALEVARQSLVLLKNNGILPLDRTKNKRIAVVGPTASSVEACAGQLQRHAVAPGDDSGRHPPTAGSSVDVTYCPGSPITTEAGRGRGPGGGGGGRGSGGAPARPLGGTSG